MIGRQYKLAPLAGAALALTLASGDPAALEVSGNAAIEQRYFINAPLDSRQHDANSSLSLAPEFYQEWDKGRQSLLFSPFLRLDQGDDQRSHGDIRELQWLILGDDWELRLGIGKLFWGVTESQHLVDIINQTDLVEDPDGEDKLGQPMVNLNLIRDWGTVELYLLPYFRERTFPGSEGRLRFGTYIATDQAIYESDREENNLDYAARWSHSIDIFDIGLSYFYGTSRDPLFQPAYINGQPALQPYYELIHQSGIDLQATLDAWLWKLEAIHRSSAQQNYNALTAGFEYTLYGIFDSAVDLGLIYEYLYDQRGDAALTPFDNDSMIGARLAFNDVESSDLLIGVIFDHDGNGQALNLEGSRRFGDHWKLNLRGRGYSHIAPTELIYSLRRDSYLEAELVYYF